VDTYPGVSDMYPYQIRIHRVSKLWLPYPCCTVAFVIRGVAKEDTPGRARTELMRRGCSSVRVTRAAENSEMLI
jgi:hypothetical protein